jgi:hypothetical protein
MSAYSGWIKRQEVDRFPVILRANCGAHLPENEPSFPLAFLGVRGGGLLASLAELFSLPAIIAVKSYEWELRPPQKHELAGIRLTHYTPHERVGIAFGFPAELDGG